MTILSFQSNQPGTYPSYAHIHKFNPYTIIVSHHFMYVGVPDRLLWKESTYVRSTLVDPCRPHLISALVGLKT